MNERIRYAKADTKVRRRKLVARRFVV